MIKRKGVFNAAIVTQVSRVEIFLVSAVQVLSNLNFDLGIHRFSAAKVDCQAAKMALLRKDRVPPLACFGAQSFQAF